MEETPEGLAAAAATREAARLNKRSDTDAAARATASGSSPAARQKKKREEEAVAATTNASTSAAAAAAQPSHPPPQQTKPPAVHEVLFPPSFDPKTSRAASLDPSLHGTLCNPLWKGKPAKSFPFELDPFQQTAVGCLERREAVLVAAHTAAGKTAVAEYAVAMALRDRQRVVYTSPLKALSNQKYRELAEEFGDVGLLTGDVCISPHAPVLVMTTEILRSMLYRGDEGLRETAWVVFDEIHYMQDRERGVVWEEAIIFLPSGATPVFLSATLSNASEFASWVAKLRGQPCHVVYTDYRPTPLQHYAFPLGGKGLYLIADECGGFRADNFARMRKEAFGLVEEEEEENQNGEGAQEEDVDVTEDGEIRGRGSGGRGGAGRGGSRRGGGRTGGGSAGRGGASASSSAPAQALSAAVSKMVRLVKDKSLDPVIVFSFSRRACEAYATSLSRGDQGKGKRKGKGGEGGKDGRYATSNPGDKALNFNSEEEALAVDAVFERAVECISDPGDRDLAAVAAMRPMLRRGVGVHHSGLLPILKELVELLFQEGLVKALFATETFAMGLNMPAKTVVFTELRKWDGQAHRWVTSGEYIQMSGRAGRRGKDDRGVCISVVDDAFDGPAARALLKGGAAPLLSSFRLSYYTLLNLARRAGGGAGKDAEFVVSRSFRQHQHEAAAPLLREAAEEAQRSAEGAAEAAVREVTEFVSSKGSSKSSPSPEKKKRKKGDDGDARALVESAVSLLAEAEGCRRALVDALLSPATRAAEFLRPGRLVRVRDGDDDWGWGIAVAVARTAAPAAAATEDKGKGAAAAAAAAAAASAAAHSADSSTTAIVVDVLLACEPGSVVAGGSGGESGTIVPRPASRYAGRKSSGAAAAEAHVVPVPLQLVEAVSSLRVGIPSDLRSQEAKAAALATLDALEEVYGPGGTKAKEGGGGGGGEAKSHFSLFSSYPLLDPIADASADDPEVLSASRRLAELEKEISKLCSISASSSSFSSDAAPAIPPEALDAAAPSIEGAARARAAALARADALSEAARSSQIDLYRAEARKRTAVLKILGHLDEDGVLLTLKGRAAAEVDAADELLASELMFNGVFAGLDAPRLAALVSCLVPCEKSQTVVELAASLAGPLAELQATARRIAEVQVECGVFARGGGSGVVGGFGGGSAGAGGGRGRGASGAAAPGQAASAAASSSSAEAELYCESFKPTLMDTVATWASGGTFQQAVDRTEMFEGSLIRAIRRLDEVLGQLGGAAEAVGDSGLAARFAEASRAIRRGIVFAASLYI